LKPESQLKDAFAQIGISLYHLPNGGRFDTPRRIRLLYGARSVIEGALT
jgi:hypothetical protein